jgi:predicted nucleotidyltransferase
MFRACGETYESLLPFEQRIDLDGVPVRTVSLEGLLKTKQTYRDKDALDRVVIERTLQGSSEEGSP